ncbi:B3 domain-containing protein REM17 isoform X1 [Lactuca sativa]|uniref:TF-B3 domain-containing protein n=1 Tax=Lactuca sativa TaxID=4236 RepID=A0A9R1VQV6_LACSA|nr:B3 domain-containing protein REM17 isoform X1 [Lactuca sativa]KAJ0209804.1 hypothetical protein LSAT_V11C400160870 [Lactuca sativa]
MAPRPRGIPSFFKIMLDCSATHLPLPTGFVRKHLENNIPENATLRSVNGGYSWRLKIKKDGDIYCFADGWKQVIEDTRLEFGDFIVFWLLGRSIFKFLIFGTNGCEKKFPLEHDHIHDDEEEDDDIDGDAGDPCFTKVIPKKGKQKFALVRFGVISNHKFIIYNDNNFCLHQRFPLEFARLIRLTAGRTMSMKNLEGKEWPVRLLSEGGHYTRYYLSKGWSEFLRDNDICEGDTCVFKYLRTEDKFCLAEITKKRVQADRAMAVEGLKRPRGRPARVVVEQPAGKVLKRPRGRPPRVEVAVEKKVRPTEPDEGLKRKSVESKDGGVEMVKRPRGRPFKKKMAAEVDKKP